MLYCCTNTLSPRKYSANQMGLISRLISEILFPRVSFFLLNKWLVSSVQEPRSSTYRTSALACLFFIAHRPIIIPKFITCLYLLQN